MLNLKALRESIRLSQAEAAKLLDTPLNTLQNWEQGRYKPSKLILKGIRIIYSEYEKGDVNRKRGLLNE